MYIQLIFHPLTSGLVKYGAIGPVRCPRRQLSFQLGQPSMRASACGENPVLPGAKNPHGTMQIQLRVSDAEMHLNGFTAIASLPSSQRYAQTMDPCAAIRATPPLTRHDVFEVCDGQSTVHARTLHYACCHVAILNSECLTDVYNLVGAPRTLQNSNEPRSSERPHSSSGATTRFPHCVD
jgi:hypothetical protein